jgi:hypothetical protein
MVKIKTMPRWILYVLSSTFLNFMQKNAMAATIRI